MNLESNIKRIKQMLKGKKDTNYRDKSLLMNTNNRKILYEALIRVLPLIEEIELLSSIVFIRENIGPYVMDKIHFHKAKKELLYIKFKLIQILKYSQENLTEEYINSEKEFIKNIKKRKPEELHMIKAQEFGRIK